MRLTEIYRHLHAHPEVSRQEARTSAFVKETLETLGLTVRHAGKYGLYADILPKEKEGAERAYVVLRADMDALPVTEETGLSYASEEEGVMHACGHDAHMTMLLGGAERLLEVQKEGGLPRPVRLLFQPAEEVTEGAAEMLANQALPERTAAAFAMHVWPGVPLGTLAGSAPYLMASADVFRISIKGRSAHVAMRKEGANALETAVQIAVRLSEEEKNASDARSILFVGEIRGGTSHNIVAEEAFLQGTIRTYDPKDRDLLIEAVEKAVLKSCERFGTEGRILWSRCPAVQNDKDLLAMCAEASEEGKLPPLTTEVTPSLAGEDFAEFQKRVPGLLLWIGTGHDIPLHNARFYVPEEVLEIGAKTWKEIACLDFPKN